MTQKKSFSMFNTNRYKSVQARAEVTNKNQLSSDNSRRVFNIVEYFLQYNQVHSCNSTIASKKLDSFIFIRMFDFQSPYLYQFYFLLNTFFALFVLLIIKTIIFVRFFFRRQTEWLAPLR
ncbi:hypothetical protein EDEG_02956 [Edhazardia aedis USNM 41457]|uniref:Transmembrane protein n=1 Tax=Edhazardia aedis (strain USNM 41457) TaxID=1003232 RepID=J9D4C3_EDHAE|nr:hypothetical protein EDEG_02956 [Edhazardia aedis USNM 41457]|eukprot:EJW02636.1 hypothetical protein EDEG_02956 [Edhazardia aedis USNM 41457]